MDFLIVNHGSIWTFQPLTEAAEAHCNEKFPDDCQMFGRAYVVEWRYARAIVEDLQNEGFAINSDKE